MLVFTVCLVVWLETLYNVLCLIKYLYCICIVISLQLQCFLYKAVIFPNKDMVLSGTFVTEMGLAAGCKAFNRNIYGIFTVHLLSSLCPYMHSFIGNMQTQISRCRQ